MMQTNQSPRWHFNKVNLLEALWLLLHVLIGTLLWELIALAGHFDYGQYAPYAVVGLSFASKIVGQWFSGPVCTGMSTGATTTTYVSGATQTSQPTTPAAGQ